MPRPALLALAALFAAAASPAGASLDPLLAGDLWQTPADAFEEAVGIRGE